jgi:hypothetical protein
MRRIANGRYSQARSISCRFEQIEWDGCTLGTGARGIDDRPIDA